MDRCVLAASCCCPYMAALAAPITCQVKSPNALQDAPVEGPGFVLVSEGNNLFLLYFRVP